MLRIMSLSHFYAQFGRWLKRQLQFKDNNNYVAVTTVQRSQPNVEIRSNTLQGAR
jgi:hypothetical protein